MVGGKESFFIFRQMQGRHLAVFFYVSNFEKRVDKLFYYCNIYLNNYE